MKNIKFLFILCASLFAYNGSITGSSFVQYTNESGDDEFSVSRSYFLYKNSITKRSIVEVLMDATYDVETGHTLILNNAFLTTHRFDHNFQLGIIPLTTFTQHEKNWGYRYVEKSPLDYYGFSSEADVGIGVSGQFKDKLQYSFQLTNGEGYDALQQDNSEKLSGLIHYTHHKKEEIPFNANFGGVFSYEIGINDAISWLNGFFSSFKFLNAQGGVEFTIYKDNRGAYTEGQLVSFYGSYEYNRKISFFHRQDYYNKNKKIKNLEDIKYVVSGMEYRLNEEVSIAPNFKQEYFRGNDGKKDELVYCLNIEYNF